jgi:drug/metabolite transporter (DMT)-like permease
MRPSASPLAIWAGILTLYLVWGSTYLGIKIAIGTIPPFVMGFLRFVPAGLLLAGTIALRNRSTMRRPTLREVRDTTIVGACLLLGGMGLVAWGEQTVASGIAALLIGLMPMWLAIFSRIFLGERLPVLATAGIAVGLAGIGLLMWPVDGVGALDPAGTAALIVSPMAWSLGSIYSSRRAVLPAPALFATGLQMVAGGIILLVVAVLTGELGAFDPATVSASSWIGVFYLFAIGSLVGYTTYAWLLTVAPLPRIATYAYVNPVVAVILGWLILGEPLSIRTGIAAFVIIVAVVMIVTARGRAARSDLRSRLAVRTPVAATGEAARAR